MAFAKDKISPSCKLIDWLPPVILKNVRSSNIQKTSRHRQCFKCMDRIPKGDEYINHQFRYDKSIKTISFHKECF